MNRTSNQGAARILLVLSLFLGSILTTSLATCAQGSSKTHRALAERVLSRAHNSTGFVLHLGVNDAALAVSLSGQGRFLVKGISFNETTRDSLRHEVLEEGVYGLVTIDYWPAGDRLPVASELADVLVIDDVQEGLQAGFDLKEAVRIMGSYAIACVGDRSADSAIDLASLEAKVRDALKTEISEGLIHDLESFADVTGTWVFFKRNKRKNWDTWPYSNHGPDGNALSLGKAPDRPTCLRYYTGRPGHYGAGWGREITSGDGRLINSYNGRTLEARNIDNGMKLWSIPFQRSIVGINSVPADGKIYAYLNNELVSLSARDGRVQARYYEAADRPREVLVDGGHVIGVDEGGVHAFEALSTERLWNFPERSTRALPKPHSLVSSRESVFFVYGNTERGEPVRVRAAGIRQGNVLWDRPITEQSLGTTGPRDVSFGRLVYAKSNDILLVQGNQSIQALGGTTGEPLYIIKNQGKRAPGNLGTANPVIYNGFVAMTYSNLVELRDLATGDLRREIRFQQRFTQRCQTPKIVDDKLFIGYANHIFLDSGEVFENQIVKVQCKSGFHVAHGKKIGVIPSCLCFPMLRGYVALVDPPLHRGKPTTKLFTSTNHDDDGLAEETTDDAAWPMQGGDIYRSGAQNTDMPNRLRKTWTLPLPARTADPIAEQWHNNPYIRGPYSQVVVACGVGVVASSDTHQVISFDSSEGELRWSFLADNKVDTAPTIYRGSVYLGTRQGTVYCLDLESGKERWRLRVAPHEGDGILNWASLESPWPVPGSVYIEDGLMLVSAGLHPEADGGVFLYGIDPSNGEILWKNVIEQVAVEPAWERDRVFGREAALMGPVGLMSKDGNKVCMSRFRIDPKSGQFRNDPGSGLKKVGKILAPIEDNYGAPMDRVFTTAQCVFDQQRLCISHALNNTILCAKGDVFRELAGKNFPSAVLDRKEEIVRLDKYKMLGGKTFTEFVAKRAQWQFSVGSGRDLIMGMAMADGRLYVVHKPESLVVLDLRNGEVVQRIDLDAEPCFQGISIANGCVFVTTAQGILNFGVGD